MLGQVLVHLRNTADALFGGLVVDDGSGDATYVRDVTNLPVGSYRVRAGYLLGMASSANAKFVLLLDINRIFSSDEITAVAETPTEAWLEELPTQVEKRLQCPAARSCRTSVHE